jgi:hypothetical protein
MNSLGAAGDDDSRAGPHGRASGRGRESGGHGGAAGGPGENGERLAGQAALLGEMTALRREARKARRAYWFPVLLFGLLTTGALPFYLMPSLSAGLGPDDSLAQRWLPGLSGLSWSAQPYLGFYWLAALPIGLVATMLFYRWYAGRVGLQTSARGYLITGAVLFVLAVLVPLAAYPPVQHWPRLLGWAGILQPVEWIRGTYPLVIIGIGLLVLARAERSWALAIIASVFTAVALVDSFYDVENLGYYLGSWSVSAAYATLPGVVPCAAILLACGAAGGLAALRQRPRSPA